MNKLPQIFLSIIFAFCFFPAVAKENKALYTGGMLILQPGHLTGNNHLYSFEANTHGVGGIFRFYFLKYGTIGIYGGTQQGNYPTKNSSDSFLQIGYGGPFIGLSFQKNKFRYTFSSFVGKGTLKNLHIDKQTGTQLEQAHYVKQGITIFSPIASMDYALSKRLYLTLQTVYLLSYYEESKLHNPIVQIGLLFHR